MYYNIIIRYVLKIYRPKYIDSKYIEYRLKIYRPQYIKIYAKCIYFFKTSRHSLQILRKSTKKYEGDLGLGEAII